jgi:SAM-dependent methyltransferase
MNEMEEPMSEDMTGTGLANERDTFGPGFMAISEALGRYDSTQEDAARVVELLGLTPGAEVLDAACGFGRFAVALMEHGCEVVGVDISQAALAEAERRCPGPRYVVGDLSGPLALGPFDAVVNVFSSFGYCDTVEDDQRVLDGWHRMLRPGGRLVMELSDMERARFSLGAPGDVTNRVTNRVVERLTVDPETHVLKVRHELDGYVIHVEIRLYEADDLERRLAAAGFKDIRRYGGFDRRPKRPEDRLVIVASA